MKLFFLNHNDVQHANRENLCSVFLENPIALMTLRDGFSAVTTMGSEVVLMGNNTCIIVSR